MYKSERHFGLDVQEPIRGDYKLSAPKLEEESWLTDEGADALIAVVFIVTLALVCELAYLILWGG